MASIWLAGTLIHPQQIPICRTFGSGRQGRSGGPCPWRRLSLTMELARWAPAGSLAGSCSLSEPHQWLRRSPGWLLLIARPANLLGEGEKRIEEEVMDQPLTAWKK